MFFKVFKSFATIVGTMTIIGIILTIGLCIFDYVTRKPIGYKSYDDDDDLDCPYYIDPDELY